MVRPCLRDTPAFFLLAFVVACGSKPVEGASTDNAPPTVTDADTDTDTDTDADADTDADTDTDTDADTDTDVPTTDADYLGTTVVPDGDLSEWGEWERFDTTDGTSTWIGWDATNLFVAVQHPDLAAPTADHWVVVTTGDGGAGSVWGTTLGTQQPGLAFEATRQVRWKADSTYSDLQVWNGAAWEGTESWLGSDGSAAFHSGEVVELVLPRAALGLGDEALVHVHLVYEGAGAESTYAGVPSSSFVSGYDPDFLAWYAFDLGGVLAPAFHTPMTGTAPTEPVDTGTPPTDTGTPPTDTGTPPIDTGLPVGWSFTPTLDGDASEWPADTLFTTGSKHTARIAWDATNLYLSVTHPDIATGGGLHWLTAYLGDDASGALDSIPLGTQQAALPFAADVALRYKADSSYDVLSTWNGAGWDDTVGFLSGPGAFAESGETLEVALPWSRLGVAAQFDLHLAMVYEGPGYESTFNGLPATSFVDGSYDPDYTARLRLDRDSTVAPAQHAQVIP